MIFLENNQGKIFLMGFLVLIFFVAIFWRWWEYNPFKRVDTGNTSETWSQILDQSGEAFGAAKVNLDLGLDAANNLPEDFERAQKQQELLEVTQEYLDHKTASSTATSSDEQTDSNNE